MIGGPSTDNAARWQRALDRPVAGAGDLGVRRSGGVAPGRPLPDGLPALVGRGVRGGQLPPPRLPRPAPAARLRPGLPDPLPLGRADGREAARLLGVVAPALPAGLRRWRASSLFRHAAGRVVRGVPLLLAVAIFAVSFHPIRHAADVKPYASRPARGPRPAGAGLRVVAAPGADRPALGPRGRRADRAGAVAPGDLRRRGDRRGPGPGGRASRAATGLWIAYAAFVLEHGRARSSALYAVFTRAQAAATLSTMQAQWTAAFPPLERPAGAWLKWLATVHTGSMFAYPCGGENGASSLTLLAVPRRGRRALAAGTEDGRC